MVFLAAIMNNTTTADSAASVDVKEPRYWVVAPFLVLILTTCAANILVIIITTVDSKLKGTTYMYVTSLAVADVMVSFLI